MNAPDAVREAVRAACEANNIEGWKCMWPDCSCLFDGSGEVFLTTLLASARAEGARAEREAAFQLCMAAGRGLVDLADSKRPDDEDAAEEYEGAAFVVHELASAIRARATEAPNAQ